MIYLFTVLEFLAFFVLIALLVLAAKKFKTLPEIIPTHFDPNNEPDAYGNRRWIFLYPLLGVVFFVGFMFLLRDPEGFNYPVEINPENRDRQFAIALIAMRVLLIIVLLIFLNILDYSVRKALDENSKPVAGFAAVILTVILFTTLMITIASIID